MATRTLSNAGGDYNVAATWVEVAVPTSADDVVFTATSGNLNLPSGVTCNAKTFICTNWVGTLTSTNTTGSLIIANAGSLTFVAGMSVTATNTLQFMTSAVGTASCNFAGKTWGGIILIPAGTLTTSSDITCTGNLNTCSVNTVIINGLYTFYVGGGFTQIAAWGVQGTTTIYMNGSGNLSGTGEITNPLTINTL